MEQRHQCHVGLWQPRLGSWQRKHPALVSPEAGNGDGALPSRSLSAATAQYACHDHWAAAAPHLTQHSPHCCQVVRTDTMPQALWRLRRPLLWLPSATPGDTRGPGTPVHLRRRAGWCCCIGAYLQHRAAVAAEAGLQLRQVLGSPGTPHAATGLSHVALPRKGDQAGLYMHCANQHW